MLWQVPICQSIQAVRCCWMILHFSHNNNTEILARSRARLKEKQIESFQMPDLVRTTLIVLNIIKRSNVIVKCFK